MQKIGSGKPGPGRPPGSRNKRTLWLEGLSPAGTQKAIALVEKKIGEDSLPAAALLLGRVWPRRRGQPVEFELPPLEKPADLVQAHAALVTAVSRGELTPGEASEVSALLENQRRAIETHLLEERIAALEASKRAAQAGEDHLDPAIAWLYDDDEPQ